jgi:hypothetical protein
MYLLQFILFIIVCISFLFYDEPIYYGNFTLMNGSTVCILLDPILSLYSCCVNLVPFVVLPTRGGYLTHSLLRSSCYLWTAVFSSQFYHISYVFLLTHCVPLCSTLFHDDVSRSIYTCCHGPVSLLLICAI